MKSGGLAFQVEKRLGGNAESLMEPSDHMECQFALAVKHLMDAIATADERNEIARL